MQATELLLLTLCAIMLFAHIVFIDLPNKKKRISDYAIASGLIMWSSLLWASIGCLAIGAL